MSASRGSVGDGFLADAEYEAGFDSPTNHGRIRMVQVPTECRGNFSDKPELYRHLRKTVGSIVAGERDLIANAANCAAILFHTLPDINWAGFYLLQGEELVLGPFQGKPACVRIAVGRGVCGTAAETRQTLVVPNVHEFPGHIACDAASRSEIVVPLLVAHRLIGVLDIDSPLMGRFDSEDAQGLQRMVETLLAASELESFPPTV